MIQDKDVSTLCDERHVKYRRNTNLLTQKNTGGKRIMGNQGTKNWKLTALFAVSLMLIAGLFSNAAIADGEGTITVEWAVGGTALLSTFPGVGDAAEGPTELFDPLEAGVPDPLPAGSEENQLRFLYRVSGTNMSRGQVRVKLPGDGWKIVRSIATDHTDYEAFTGTLVEVHQRIGTTEPTVLYRSNKDGKTLESTGDIELEGSVAPNLDVLKARAAQVTAEDGQITVTFGKDWRNGGNLLIVLRRVTAGIPASLSPDVDAFDPPYHNYEFTTYSKKSGILSRLRPVKIDHDGDADETTPTATIFSTQPFVRVGNIIGNRRGTEAVPYVGSDTVERNFEITGPASTDPLVVYENEANRVFKITYTAKGPMYTVMQDADTTHPASIVITIPDHLLPSTTEVVDEDGDGDPGQEADLTAYIRNHIRVTQSGRVKLRPSTGALNPAIGDGIDGKTVTIDLDWINKDAKVILTYTFEGAPDYAAVITDDEATRPGDDTAFTIMTTVPNRAGNAVGTAEATTITGGEIHPQVGSGKMAFTNPSDAQVEADTRVSTLKLTYTAATKLDDVALVISVNGIVLEGTDKILQFTVPPTGNFNEDEGYGHVSSSDPDLIPVIGTADNTITWNGLSFAKAGDTFETTIEKVDIQEDGMEVPWPTTIGIDGTDGTLGENPVLYITSTVNNAVEFAIDGASFASYNAAQDVPSIVFTFTAKTTAIKDGKVQFSVPSSWKPLPTSADAAGKTTVTIAGTATTEGISYGRTVSVTVPKLAVDETVEITYGGGGDKGFTMQPTATPDDKPIEIPGRFWTSSPLNKLRSAGNVDVEVTQVLDGYGTATIKAAAANAATVKAGSDNNIIQVEFTAVGTMDGGAVSLERPAGWGGFQDDDATNPNYIEARVVSGRGKVSTVDVGPEIVIVHLETFAPNAKIRFTYGGGTVRIQNGATAQTSIGLAEFTIQSDGDGDGLFGKVRGDKRVQVDIDKTAKPLGAAYRDGVNPGVLRIDVTGAGDGSGTAEVEIVKPPNKAQAMYPDIDDSDGDGNRAKVLDDLMRIHAGDTNTYLKFTYTPEETIQDGQLIFTTIGDWSDPQSVPGVDGYTYVIRTGTATDISQPVYDETDKTATVDISYIDTGGTIEIHYGALDAVGDGSGAHAPKAASSRSPFKIEIQGGDASTNKPSAIKTAKSEPIAVRVLSQASGGGGAAVIDGAR